jgi:DNA-binding NarL/FixJ family response regulator
MVLTESPPQAITHATVLLIDDDEADLKHWSDTVRNFAPNYTILKAPDCRSGLAICRDRTVDCVLLDLDMPESGFHALLELVPDRQHPPIAVVILTRLVHPSLSELAKYNGAQGWLVKQHTSPEKLCAAIQQAMSFVKSTRKH